MSNDADHHNFYLRQRHVLACDASALTQEEVDLLERYGNWMTALTSGLLRPFTPEQRRFLQVHAGSEAASSKFEKCWRRYHAQQILRKAQAANADIDNYGYDQTVRLFDKAARLGVAEASEWLAAEGRYAPTEELKVSLTVPEAKMRLSVGIDTDHTNPTEHAAATDDQVDWSDGKDDLDQEFWERMLAGPDK